MARKAKDETVEEQDENLGNILDRSWDDMPEELILPDGTYMLSVRNIVYVPPKDNSNGKVIAFFIPKEAMEDVDVDALSALGPDYDITENEVTATYWIERNRDWAPVKKLLSRLGVETEGGVSMKETFKKAKRKEVAAYVTTRSFNRADGTSVTQNIATEFPAA